MSSSTAIESFAQDSTSADQCLATPDLQDELDQASAYECPAGVPYCQRDSQCDGYCGPGGFDLCYRGCCTCSG